MKKLMILAAVAMVAFASQAAKAKWATGSVEAPGAKGAKQSEVAAEGAKWYILTIESGDYAGYLAQTYADASKAIWETYGGDNLPAEPTKTLSSTGQTTYTSTMSGEDMYIASILTYTDESGNDWYIANVDHVNNTGTGTVSSPNKMGETWYGKEAGAIGAWTAAAVPEPTSGLLLLLGVAGLALRRRRA